MDNFYWKNVVPRESDFSTSIENGSLLNEILRNGMGLLQSFGSYLELNMNVHFERKDDSSLNLISYV